MERRHIHKFQRLCVGIFLFLFRNRSFENTISTDNKLLATWKVVSRADDEDKRLAWKQKMKSGELELSALLLSHDEFFAIG